LDLLPVTDNYHSLPNSLINTLKVRREAIFGPEHRALLHLCAMATVTIGKSYFDALLRK
jgi:hypothetical protein